MVTHTKIESLEKIYGGPMTPAEIESLDPSEAGTASRVRPFVAGSTSSELKPFRVPD